MTDSASITGPRDARFPLPELLERVDASDKRIDLSGVESHLLPYLVHRLGAHLKRPIMVVAPEESDARRIAQDLRFLTGPSGMVEHRHPSMPAPMESSARIAAQ